VSNGHGKPLSVGIDPPPYRGSHLVRSAGWNYTPDVACGSLVVFDLEGVAPPDYELAIRTSTMADGEEEAGYADEAEKEISLLSVRKTPSPRASPSLTPTTGRTITSSISGLFSPTRIQARVNVSILGNYSRRLRAKDSIRIHRQR